MGASINASPAQRDAYGRHWEERRRLAVEATTRKRMALADKIVLAIVDRISADIIRPGPKPEERECYVMAQELREHSAPLKELVAAILEIEAKESPYG